nr:MAG TPA: hypothetical protein [Caudoviricetes sp.]
MFIAIKHSLRIITSYLCREGGEYNTRKGNNPSLLVKAFEPLGDPMRSNLNIEKFTRSQKWLIKSQPKQFHSTISH